MTGQLALAQVNKVTNGYMVRFAEATEQERPLPSPFPPGHLQIQAEIMLALSEGRDDDDLVDASGGWNEHMRDTQRQRVEQRIKAVEASVAKRRVKGWVLDMRECFVPTLAQLGPVLEHAAHAFDKIERLVAQGTQFFGPLQPSMLHVPG